MCRVLSLSLCRAAVEHCLHGFSSLMYQLPNKMADKMQRRNLFLLLGSLVVLLRNKYDTASRLLLAPHPLSASFEWQSLPLYHTDGVSLLHEAASSSSSKLARTVESSLTQNTVACTPTECRLTHLGCSVPYGFEFQGLGHRVFLLPEVERGVVDLLHCMEREGTAFVSPTGHETSVDITRDIAQVWYPIQSVLVKVPYLVNLSSYSFSAAPWSTLLFVCSPSLLDTFPSPSAGAGCCGNGCHCITAGQWGVHGRDSYTSMQMCGRTAEQTAGEGG